MILQEHGALRSEVAGNRGPRGLLEFGDDVAGVGVESVITSQPYSNGETASGNYVALSATHYPDISNPLALATAAPVANQMGANNQCNTGSYCGNGILAFPGTVSNKITKKGYAFRSMSDGTSKTTVFTESREQDFSSWYSGLSSYVTGVGVNRGANVANQQVPVGVQANSNTSLYQRGWTFNIANREGLAAINQGSNKSTTDEQNKYYARANQWPHNGQARRWGPSSLHPGVAIHGFGDGHSSPLQENIDGDLYLALITRNGGEPASDF